MKPEPSTDSRPPRSQRGDALLEALIGILLMAVISLGMTYALARVFNSHRMTSTQNIAITQMRNLLVAGAGLDPLCGSSPILRLTLNAKAGAPTNVGIPAVVTCPVASAIAVGVSGNATFNQTVNFRTRLSIATPADSATAKSLFGGDGIVTVSQ